jgi:hypothetical protein
MELNKRQRGLSGYCSSGYDNPTAIIVFLFVGKRGCMTTEENEVIEVVTVCDLTTSFSPSLLSSVFTSPVTVPLLPRADHNKLFCVCT